MLYAEKSGYLLLENLKAQWENAIHPDYVFIDSRTGHTDVSGICTRQLPDAVVVNFVPNSQNLIGLKDVVKDIRTEKSRTKKDIKLHFVSSNTPNDDDEYEILSKNLQKFQKELGYDRHSLIHYYSSLALLEQPIFVLARPNTRLAREYNSLADNIIRENAADRDGALLYLKDIQSQRRILKKTSIDRLPATEVITPIDAHLKDIEARQSYDGEVLSKLAEVASALGRTSDAEDMYIKAVASTTVAS